MIGDLDTELDRAEDRMPFSNSTEGDAWTGRWCERCTHNTADDCALVTVALLGKTPFSWIEVNPASLSRRYLCADYRDIEDNDSDQARRGDRPLPPGPALHPPAWLEPAGRHRRV